jgi:hypothetical protein
MVPVLRTVADVRGTAVTVPEQPTMVGVIPGMAVAGLAPAMAEEAGVAGVVEAKMVELVVELVHRAAEAVGAAARWAQVVARGTAVAGVAVAEAATRVEAAASSEARTWSVDLTLAIECIQTHAKRPRRSAVFV